MVFGSKDSYIPNLDLTGIDQGELLAI